jgi:glycosyltransferase involved in cell wall biosynthesis
MSVYNGEKYLRESVDSILNQTYENFEFIIINDGSNDASLDILGGYQSRDNRLLIVNQENIGLTSSLNRAIKLTVSQYIARHDADDICAASRLEKQLRYMENHPEVAVVGCLADVFDANEVVHKSTDPKFKLSPSGIKRYLAKKNLFMHGSAMMRKSCLAKAGFYREFFRHSQDYDLWLRLSKHFDLAILPEHLYQYRVTAEAVSASRCQAQKQYAELARKLHAERLATGKDSYDKLVSFYPDGLPVREVPNKYDYHIFLAGEFVSGNKLSQARKELRKAWKLGCRRPQIFYLFFKSLLGAGLLDMGRKVRSWFRDVGPEI